MSFIKKAILVGDVINQGRKIYNGRHACLTKENNSFITKCDGIITNCDSLVYYEVRWTVITNCDSFFITKCDTVYYKLRQVLQSAMDLLQIATGITKCDDYYKLRQYMVAFSLTLSRFSPTTQPLASLCTPPPPSRPLACLGFACSNFAKKKKIMQTLVL